MWNNQFLLLVLVNFPNIDILVVVTISSTCSRSTLRADFLTSLLTRLSYRSLTEIIPRIEIERIEIEACFHAYVSFFQTLIASCHQN